MRNFFTESLTILARKDELLASKLEAVEPNGMDWCETRQGEKNLSYQIQGKTFYLHSNYSAQKETEKWLQSLHLQKISLIYVYGVGAGYSFDLLRSWLKESKERYLVYIEEDPRILRRVLETERGRDLVKSRQVVLSLFDPDLPESLELLCQRLAQRMVNLPFAFTALPHYAQSREAGMNRLQTQLLHASAYVGFLSQECFDYGMAFFRNFYVNTLRLPEACGSSALFEDFKGKPAIICGAGPSLNKNFDLLKTLENRALIFAGGSAINALTCRGLIPHFGGSVDPNPTQYERMINQQGFEMPIFYKGRIYFRALEMLHGPHVYVSGNNGYPITGWIQNKLKIPEKEILEGHNVLHMLISCATLMQCNPIIFVGMDLAFTGLQTYASAVVDRTTVTEKEITKGSSINDNAFLRPGIDGQPVYTLWKWVAEAQYTAHWAKGHPSTQFINATEGGLGFEGIPNMTLEEVKKHFLNKQFDGKGLVHASLQRSGFPAMAEEDVQRELASIANSLKSCLEICQEMGSQIKKLRRFIEKQKASAINAVLNEMEALDQQLIQETAYKMILEPVNHMRSVLFERKFDQIADQECDYSDLERMLLHCDSQEEELRSLHECASINLKILTHSITIYRDQGHETDAFYSAFQPLSPEIS